MLACLGFAMAQQSERPARPDLAVRETQVVTGVKVVDAPRTFDKYEELTRDLLSRYKASNDTDERGELLQELGRVVEREFDARYESRSQDLKILEERLDELRTLHKRRANEKSSIVKERVLHLVRDADGLGWGTDRIGTR